MGDILMTELLHMHDNYLRDFDAVVLETGADYLVLDRTAFYPEGGGQVGDRGEISSSSVRSHVSDTKKVGSAVHHMIPDGRSFSVGESVHGRLDWTWRYQSMRYHTAQHVLSRYLQLEHNLETVGNQVKPGESRADFQPINEIGEQMRTDIESGVNELLKTSLKVNISFMPRSEAVAYLKERGYQVRYLEMVPRSVTQFRVVTIGDWDASSCAGTHVANTSEVGRLKILKTKNVGAAKQRIYFTLLDT